PYLEKVLSVRPLLAVQTEETLEAVTQQLRDELAPPREEWAETDAARLRKERLDSADALRKAVQAARNWFLDSRDQAGALWTFADYLAPASVDWPDWAARAERLLDP